MLLCTKTVLIKMMASDNNYKMCGEVGAGVVYIGRKPSIWTTNEIQIWERQKPQCRSRGDIKDIRHHYADLHVMLKSVLYTQSIGCCSSGFSIHKPFRLAYPSLFFSSISQSKNLLYQNIACIIYIMQSIYVHIVNLASNCAWMQPGQYLERDIEWT